MNTARKIDKHFVSDIDQALQQFNKTTPRSAAQQAEIDKYQRVYQQRDQAVVADKVDDIWKFD